MQNFLAPDSFSDWNKTLVCLNYPPPVSVSLPPVFSVPSHSQSWQWEQGPPLPGWSGPTSAGDCLSPAPSSSTLSASCLVFLSKVNLNIFREKEKLARETYLGSCYTTFVTCLGYDQTKTDLPPHCCSYTAHFKCYVLFFFQTTLLMSWDLRAVLTMNAGHLELQLILHENKI